MIEVTQLLGIWLATFLTLAVYSFLFKDNPLYHLAEVVFVATFMSFSVSIAAKSIRDIALDPLITKGAVFWVIPIILGIVMFTKYSTKYGWVSRYSVGVMAGIGTGLSMRTVVKAQVLDQIQATFLNPLTSDAKAIVGQPATSFNNILIIAMVFCVMVYFTFSGGSKVQESSLFNVIRKFARYSMMVAFGATFGNTIALRISQTGARIRYILTPDAFPIVPVILVALFVAMYGKGLLKRFKSDQTTKT